MLGTQSENKTSFRAVTQTLVLVHHVSTTPKLQMLFSYTRLAVTKVTLLKITSKRTPALGSLHLLFKWKRNVRTQ